MARHKYNGMEELYRLLPDEYAAPIRSRLCADKLCEVRIINDAPVRVCYDGCYYFLCRNGITKDRASAFTASRTEAENVIMRACEHSLYTVTDTIKRGYISVRGGIRIGVCGCGVMTGGDLTAVKNFSSVNIRLPHEVPGCASALFGRIVGNSDRLKNTLIISPPGVGKTTVLRDLCRTVSDRGYNVLLCDEKHEIASVANGAPTLDVGCRTDVICGVDKKRVFDMGIAHMRPDIIMADELFPDELECVVRAATCGIAVAATVHARNTDELKAKPEWRSALAEKVFSLFAVLTGVPHREIKLYEDTEIER